MPSHSTVFNLQWKKEFPFIAPVADDKKKALCTTCGSIFTISHGGKSDVTQHIKTERYKKGSRTVLVNHNIGDLFKRAAGG
jgi:hypothetical protein